MNCVITTQQVHRLQVLQDRQRLDEQPRRVK
jgi:hypothetical protein